MGREDLSAGMRMRRLSKRDVELFYEVVGVLTHGMTHPFPLLSLWMVMMTIMCAFVVLNFHSPHIHGYVSSIIIF